MVQLCLGGLRGHRWPNRTRHTEVFPTPSKCVLAYGLYSTRGFIVYSLPGAPASQSVTNSWNHSQSVGSPVTRSGGSRVSTPLSESLPSSDRGPVRRSVTLRSTFGTGGPKWRCEKGEDVSGGVTEVGVSRKSRDVPGRTPNCS